MRKTKSQKGITLIALIITIIVLLILAVVAIGAVQDDGIIDHAKNARDQYSTAQTNENSTIQAYLDKIQEHVGTGSGVASGTGGNTKLGNLGKYVKYDTDEDGSVEDETILWRVLRDDEDKVELITADALGTLDLKPTDFNDARTKYNNAVALMVQKCVELTGISSVRNVGGPATEEELSDTNTVKFTNYSLGNFMPTVSAKEFEKYEGATNGLRKEEENYEEDWNQMKKAGVAKPDNSKVFWVSSRLIEDDSESSVYFCLCNIDGKANGVGMTRLCYVGDNAYSSTYENDYEMDYGVRPILTLEPEIFDEASETGEKTDPIKIY